MLSNGTPVRFALLPILLVSALPAAEFTPFTANTPDGLAAMAAALLGSTPGITVVPGSIVFSGTTSGISSASFAHGVDLGTQGTSFYELSQDGILFTTGNAVPPQTNTSSSFGVMQAVDITDPALTALVGQTTHDLTSLDFDFTADPGINSLGFEFMFMSEEYPEFVGKVVDATAIYVDGTNYAYYLGNPKNYLSVNSDSLTATGLFFNNATSALPIEYDGVTRPAGVLAPLNPALTKHHVRIAIADTIDQIYDSAILVADITGSTAMVTTSQAGIVPLASPRMINYTINAAETTSPITIPVRLSEPALVPVTVTYKVVGTAILNVDYRISTTTSTGTLTYAVGEYLKKIIITPLTDGVIDGKKTVIFSLTDATKAIPLRHKVVTINLRDVDSDPKATSPLVGDGGGTLCGAGSGLGVMMGGLSLLVMRLASKRRRA